MCCVFVCLCVCVLFCVFVCVCVPVFARVRGACVRVRAHASVRVRFPPVFLISGEARYSFYWRRECVTLLAGACALSWFFVELFPTAILTRQTNSIRPDCTKPPKADIDRQLRLGERCPERGSNASSRPNLMPCCVFDHVIFEITTPGGMV